MDKIRAYYAKRNKPYRGRQILYHYHLYVKSKKKSNSDFPGGSDGKVSACNTEDPGLIPWLGRSPGEGNGNPFQYACLENPMGGRAW